jgi:hypothetical protein
MIYSYNLCFSADVNVLPSSHNRTFESGGLIFHWVLFLPQLRGKVNNLVLYFLKLGYDDREFTKILCALGFWPVNHTSSTSMMKCEHLNK